MAGAYGKAGKHLALARRCVLDGRLTHPPDGKRRGGGGWDEQLPPGKGRRGRAGDMRPRSSARPLGPWRRAPRGGGSPRPSGGAAVSARLRRAETKAPAAMAAGAKKGFALPPPPRGRPGEAEGPAVTSSSARRGCPSGGGNGAACHRIGSRLPQWRERWGWR